MKWNNLIKEGWNIYNKTNFKNINEKEFLNLSSKVLNDLNNINLDDLNEFFMNKNKIDCNIFQQEYFNIFLLNLEKNNWYKLHNHPDMFVFTKFLQGDINIKSCDIINKEGNDIYKINNLKNYDLNFKNTWSILTPTENNLHEFYPKENTLLIDIIFNDYDHIDRKYSEFEFLSKNIIKLTQIY